MLTIKPKKKPKWYQFRKQVARFFIWLARKIEPKSDYVYSKVIEEDKGVYGYGNLWVWRDQGIARSKC